MSVRGIWGSVLVASVLTGSTIALADENVRIPSGHSYSPSQQRMPLINSRRYQFESQVDIYETEIYRSKRDAAIAYGNMRIFGNDGPLRGGSRNRPHY